MDFHFIEQKMRMTLRFFFVVALRESSATTNGRSHLKQRRILAAVMKHLVAGASLPASIIES